MSGLEGFYCNINVNKYVQVFNENNVRYAYTKWPKTLPRLLANLIFSQTYLSQQSEEKTNSHLVNYCLLSCWRRLCHRGAPVWWVPGTRGCRHRHSSLLPCRRTAWPGAHSVQLNWWKGKPSGSIACTRKLQPRFYWSCSSVVMNDATPLTPPSAWAELHFQM